MKVIGVHTEMVFVTKIVLEAANGENISRNFIVSFLVRFDQFHLWSLALSYKLFILGYGQNCQVIAQPPHTGNKRVHVEHRHLIPSKQRILIKNKHEVL